MREYENFTLKVLSIQLKEFMREREHKDLRELSSIFPGKLNHLLLAEQILSQKPVLNKKIKENCLLDEKKVKTVLSEVVRFLNLIAYSKKKLTPAKTIDLVWHEFILCTHTYVQFCENTFGRFIHHDPGGSDEENQQQFHLTMKLYHLYYGPPSPEFWGDAPLYEAESNCGECQSIST